MKQKVGTLLFIVLIIVAVVVFFATPMHSVKFENEHYINDTNTGRQLEEEGFQMGQQIAVLPGTYAFESSEDFGREECMLLDPEKSYVINGYSYVSEADGSICGHDYWPPRELQEANGKIVKNVDGFVLMLHVCEVREDGGLRTIAWIDSGEVAD